MVKRRNSSNSLLRLIKRAKWCDVPFHLHEAKIADKTNTYPLHEVCKDSTAPIKIVNDIYYAYPQAALSKDCDLYTPLSIAAEAGFEDAVNFLANVCPKASTICGQLGSSPISAAIHGSDFNNMIDSIIIANPESAFIPDNEGDSPCDIFFHQWNVCMRIAVSYQTMCNKVLDKTTGHGDWKVKDIYEKTCLFLRAANICKMGKSYDESCLLHSALREESCHWAYCKLLLMLHPEQLLKKDANGNLPIHIATASKEMSDVDTFLCMDCFTKRNTLVRIEFLNGETRYCCDDCSEFESRTYKSFDIKPGMY